MVTPGGPLDSGGPAPPMGQKKNDGIRPGGAGAVSDAGARTDLSTCRCGVSFGVFGFFFTSKYIFRLKKLAIS